MKTRQELRVIATEFLNSSSAEEELRILDKLQVDGAKWAGKVLILKYPKSVQGYDAENAFDKGLNAQRDAINEALENREKI